MNRIRCAHCGRTEDLQIFHWKDDGGNIVAMIFICDICRSLLQKVDVSFTVDQDKIDKLKKEKELSEKET